MRVLHARRVPERYARGRRAPAQALRDHQRPARGLRAVWRRRPVIGGAELAVASTSEDAMDQTKHQEIDRDRDRLKTLRDQFRLKVHLAGMDAKDAFHEIEREAEKLEHEVKATTRRKLRALTARLETLLAPLD
jgi:hypothetical protein